MLAWLQELRRRNVGRVAGIYTVTAWAVFQVLNTLFQTLGLPKWTNTLALVLLMLGLPLAMTLAWLSDRRKARNAPAAIALADEIAAAPRREPWIDALIIAAVIAVIGVIGWQWATRGALIEPGALPVAAVPRQSIAVLPFVSFSSSPDDGFFADGLTEELINSLAQNASLKVAGRTSSFYFKGRNEDLRGVAAKLGVAHLLEGSVRRSGDTVRITAQLIKAADGFHLWSQTYDRPARDTLAIQTEIAATVARVLQVQLAGKAHPAPQRDPAAFALELESRARLRANRQADAAVARDGFRRLTEIEPGNPAAWAGLSEAVMRMAQDHLTIAFDEATQISNAAVARALALDPDSAVALRAQGFSERVQGIRSGNTDHYRRAVAVLTRAVAIEPGNADGWFLLGNAQSALGRDSDALPSLRKAIAIDPLNRGALTVTGVTLANLGRIDEAERQYQTVIDLFPDYSPALLSLARLRIATGRLDAAVPPLRRTRAIDDDAAAGLALAYVYLNLGMEPEADRTLDSIATSPTASAIATAAKMLVHRRHAELLAFARAQYATTKDPLWQNAIAMMALLTGDGETARSYFATALPGLFLPQPRADGAPFDMMSAASALDVTGDHAQARRVMRLILAQPVPPGPIDGAIVNARINARAGLGDTAGAVAELEAAVERGYRTPYEFDMFTRIDRFPLMARVAADPGFRAIMARIAADNAVQRERLRQAANSAP